MPNEEIVTCRRQNLGNLEVVGYAKRIEGIAWYGQWVWEWIDRVG